MGGGGLARGQNQHGDAGHVRDGHAEGDEQIHGAKAVEPAQDGHGTAAAPQGHDLLDGTQVERAGRVEHDGRGQGQEGPLNAGHAARTHGRLQEDANTVGGRHQSHPYHAKQEGGHGADDAQGQSAQVVVSFPALDFLGPLFDRWRVVYGHPEAASIVIWADAGERGHDPPDGDFWGPRGVYDSQDWRAYGWLGFNFDGPRESCFQCPGNLVGAPNSRHAFYSQRDPARAAAVAAAADGVAVGSGSAGATGSSHLGEPVQMSFVPDTLDLIHQLLCLGFAVSPAAGDGRKSHQAAIAHQVYANVTDPGAQVLQCFGNLSSANAAGHSADREEGLVCVGGSAFDDLVAKSSRWRRWRRR